MTVIERAAMPLFKLPQGFYLAHFIGLDLCLALPQARQIDRLYNMGNRLNALRDHIDGRWLGDYVLEGTVFNLLVKQSLEETIDEKAFDAALREMRRCIIDDQIQKLAIVLESENNEDDLFYYKKQIENAFEGMDIWLEFLS